jgi:hypothetical protein
MNVALAAKNKFALTVKVLVILPRWDAFSRDVVFDQNRVDTFSSDEVCEQNLVIEGFSGPSGNLVACVCAKGQKIEHMESYIVNVHAGDKYERLGCALLCPQHALRQFFPGR